MGVKNAAPNLNLNWISVLILYLYGLSCLLSLLVWRFSMQIVLVGGNAAAVPSYPVNFSCVMFL